MNENFNYCHVVGKTDVGKRRSANEDNMYNAITQNGLVSVVCDGMGGHVGGATASKIAVSTIIDNLNNVYYDDPRIAIGESIDKANKAIIQKTTEQPELTGMGSTCVLLLVRGGKVYIGHVGDSRIYLIRSKKIVQLTKDHSYVQMLVDCGEITKEQAEHHPRKNEITNALGIPNMSPATVADGAIIPEAGDCFVLCSDGLSGMVSDDTICKVISRQSEMNAQERVDRLVALANENGGVDNITVQLVEFSVSPNAVSDIDKNKFPIWAKISCVVSVLLVLVFCGYFWLRENPMMKTDDNSVEKKDTIKCETIDYHYSKEIVFKKDAEIVELEFKEGSLILKRDGKQIDMFESAFDSHSLNVSTPNVNIQYNNSLLSFTDKSPGDEVVFYITQLDKKKRYKFIFDISSTASGLTISKDDIKDDKNKTKSQGTEDEKKVVTKVDTFYVQFEYDKLEKGTKLLLNYSANPTLIFSGQEKNFKSPKLEKVLEEELTYDDLYWEKKNVINRSQLSFKLKGKSSNKKHAFVIPCSVRNSNNQIVITVNITPKQNGQDGSVTPKEVGAKTAQ